MESNKVLITEARFSEGRPTGGPRMGNRAPVNHQVWVGSDTDGWTLVPHVTNVDLDLRQGELRRAVITVLFPQVDFEGRTPSDQRTR